MNGSSMAVVTTISLAQMMLGAKRSQLHKLLAWAIKVLEKQLRKYIIQLYT